MPRIATGRSDTAQQEHPADCQCCRTAAPAQQSLDELAFTKSACAAAKSGNHEQLKRLIDKQPACVHWDGCGGAFCFERAVFGSICSGCKGGSGSNASGSAGDSGYTPLLYAAREGHVDVARLLLQHGQCAVPYGSPAISFLNCGHAVH
jgi:Ankyrin repeat